MSADSAAPPPRRRDYDSLELDDPPGRFWISPGARLGFATIVLGMVLLFLFTGLPAIQANRQNQLEADQRAAAQATGARLLHTYDCTYGNALRAVLEAAQRDKHTTQQLARQSRHANLTVYKRTHDQAALRAAHRSLVSYRSAKATGDSYAGLARSLKPLGKSFLGIPIPPCPKH